MNSTQPTDSDRAFTLDVQLHHPTCDPAFITESLKLKPKWALRAGQTVGSLERKSTVWHASFAEGTSDEDFSVALESFMQFLHDHSSFLASVVAEGGASALHLNVPSCGSGPVLSCVKLEPHFLEALTRNSVGIQVSTLE